MPKRLLFLRGRRWLLCGALWGGTAAGCDPPRLRSGQAPSAQSAQSAAAPASLTAPFASARTSGSTPKAERVQLVARHKLGVPVHPGQGDNAVSARLPDGSWASILDRDSDGRWLHIVSDTGIRGWITRRYAATAAAPAAAASATPSRNLDSVWGSVSGCRRRVRQLVQERPPHKAYIMSFNVRWFPDGAPGKRPGQRPTDIEWLACGIAASHADIILLQEIKRTARARQKLAELIERLDEHTGGRFVVRLDDCPLDTSQHVGVLYDSHRVKALDVAQYGSLNPHAEPCKDQLRPGFGGYFKFNGGLDLHVIGVHLKSGNQRRDHDLRARSLDGLAKALQQAQGRHRDDDVIFGGDLNTLGCQACNPPITPEQELSLLGSKLASAFELSLLPAELGCSQYYKRKAALLDHFAVSTGVLSSRPGLKTRVSGFCGELQCAVFDAQVPSAYEKLSDHCPLLIELDDRDDD